MFTQFTRYKSHATNIFLGVGVDSPIDGSGSAECVVVDSGQHAALLNSSLVIPRGLTNGKLRALFLLRENVGFGRTIRFGFVFNQSQQNILASGQAYYLAFYRTSIGSDQWRIQFYKITNGVANVTLLTEAATANEFQDNVVKALEVEWITTPTSVDIVVQSGDSPDFTDLVQEFTFSHNSSPLLTSVNEGLAFFSNQATCKILVDKYLINR
jgi:hypothetical protein